MNAAEKTAAKILELLPATRQQLEKRLFSSRVGIYRALAAMEPGTVYVGGWVKAPDGTIMAVIHKGPGKDVPRPAVVVDSFDKYRRRKAAPIFRHWMEIALFGDGNARDVYTQEEKELIWPSRSWK